MTASPTPGTRSHFALRTSTFLLLLLFAPSARAQDVASPKALIEAMQARYGDVRDATLTFVQQTISHPPDGGADTTTWYEAAMPGMLRIDFAPVEAGNGMLFANGRRYAFRNGTLVDERPDVNPLQVLLMDIYAFPAARTAEVLDTLGYDLSVLRETTWEGRPVYVVGAAEGDLTSAQFWVDKERLHTLRVIQPVGPGGSATLDARVTGHTPIGDYWQEDEIMIYVNGNLVQEEHYSDIRTGMDLDPALFDPASWSIDAPYWE